MTADDPPMDEREFTVSSKEQIVQVTHRSQTAPSSALRCCTTEVGRLCRWYASGAWSPTLMMSSSTDSWTLFSVGESWETWTLTKQQRKPYSVSICVVGSKIYDRYSSTIIQHNYKAFCNYNTNDKITQLITKKVFSEF